MWHRRPAQRRQIDPLQLPLQRQGAECKLPVLHHRAEPGGDQRPRCPFGEAGGDGPAPEHGADHCRDRRHRGPGEGREQGEGLGNKFLANIRETHAILHVLRCFEDDNIVHVDGSVDPTRDKEVIDTELQLKDLETVETRMQKVAKQASIGDKDARKQLDLYERVKAALEQGISARAVEREDSEEALFQEMQLLTGKPILYVCNVEEGAVLEGNAHVKRVQEMAASEGAGTLIIGAAIEADIAELEDPEEREMFLADLGLEEPGVAKLIRSAYSLLICRPTSPQVKKKCGPGRSRKAAQRLKQRGSSTPISKRASSARK